MQLLIEQVGAVRLAEVRRFANGVGARGVAADPRGRHRGAARVRPPRSVARRLAGGDVQRALDGFLGDYLAGKRSVLVVDDNEKAAELSSKVREELADLGLVDEHGARAAQRHAGRAGRPHPDAAERVPGARCAHRREFIVVNREVWRVEDAARAAGSPSAATSGATTTASSGGA